MKPHDVGWVVGLPLSLSANASAESAEEIATRVQNFYDKTKSFKARFEQRFEMRAYRKRKLSRGVVVFVKPGKMSFRYAKTRNRVVSDAKTIKVYDAESQRLYEQTLDKSQYPAVVSFLFGNGKLRSEFKLKKIEDADQSFKNGYRLLATPKEATAAYRKMILYVDATSYQVRRVLLIDAQGNRNRFDFSNVRVNEAVAASEFQLTPPPGTEIVR